MFGLKGSSGYEPDAHFHNMASGHSPYKMRLPEFNSGRTVEAEWDGKTPP